MPKVDPVAVAKLRLRPSVVVTMCTAVAVALLVFAGVRSPNAATWWLSADQTEDIYWRCWCYWRVVFPVPFKKKAKAVLPSSEAVGVDGLLPKVNSKLPAVSPAINTPTIPSTHHLGLAGIEYGSSACPRVRGRGIHVVLDPASRGVKLVTYRRGSGGGYRKKFRRGIAKAG